MGDNLVYAVRSSQGFYLKRGLGTDAVTVFEQNNSSKEVACNVFAYSNNGQLFAYCDNQVTRVFEIATNKEVLCLELKRTRKILFSPKDNFLLTFEPWAIYGAKTSENQKPEPNVRVYSLADGKHVSTFSAPKESSWEPQFSDDETLAARMVGSEIFFYTNMSFERYDHKLVEKGATSFALSPGSAPNHVAVYVPAVSSNPARVRVHKVSASFPVVANRTFYKSDKAVVTWNQRGNALLILASVDVDKTNQSYYGEQSLFLINIQSGDSVIVPLEKQGPIYAAKWNPNGREFAVCYGYMPAKVTFYNQKGVPIFDLLEGPRNDVFYNAFGNIVLICGFGNISKGKMEFWDVENKKEIISIEVPNTTLFDWAPDGQHFVTCTTAPRLRIDNCYRFWHYTGRMLAETHFDSPKEELWEVRWRPMMGYNKFAIKELTKTDKMAAGLPIKKKDASHPLNNVPAGAVRQAGAYIPPHLRKPLGGGGSAGPPTAVPVAPTNGNQNQRPPQRFNANGNGNGNAPQPFRPQQSEQDRKLFQLKKKVEEIKVLKQKVANGDHLQPNQLDKIKREEEYIADIAKLSI
ncbi:hypothetical protein GCK72_005539 [Caenorhabditis remanei]|uniref:Eukaryotic translation initiation factor 2A n=2 Tax=Caenorhabditis remanei TaxID=31234 RepID=E3LFT4_CAERE|nr:hypothetical protein GCK72_005539 [Caenorhabditis remanei]EFO85911.1 hypothetical protein CRE_02233 [Caenorhabditis remanei]KAF1765587.1 hypothetical protein GCK72_005539 [Caenorhabditis remanei]